MKIIEARNIRKSFRREVVLKDFDFEARKGEFILLVGANGSGKTTFLKGLLGLLRFDSGSLSVRSNKIAYVPERFFFPEFITLESFLKLFLEKMDQEMFREWGLSEARKKEMGKFSKGMRQKALLMQALYADAEVYVFDEPVSGLDEAAKETFLNKLAALKNEGKTVLLSTHNPEHFRMLADRTVGMG